MWLFFCKFGDEIAMQRGIDDLNHIRYIGQELFIFRLVVDVLHLRKAVSFPKLFGIVPLNSFSSNSTNTKSTRLPTLGLSVPSNLFSSISRTFKVSRLKRFSLSVPSRRFWSKSRTCRLWPSQTPDPHCSGMVPEVFPPSRVRFLSLFRANISAGKVPPRLFCSNPITVISPPLHLLPAQSHSELPDR